jgi:hypothetical protein
MDIRHLADTVLNEIDTRVLQDMSTRQPVGQMSWSQMRRTYIKLEKCLSAKRYLGGVVKCRMTTSSATSSSAAPSRIGMKYTVFAAYYYNAA